MKNNENPSFRLSGAIPAVLDLQRTNRLKEGDFKGYPRQKREEDLGKVKATRAVINEKNQVEIAIHGPEKQRAMLLGSFAEAVLMDKAVVEQMYQGEITALGSSDYDDIVKGVDLFWYLDNQNPKYEPLPMAIDVKLGGGEIVKALSRNLDEVNLGKGRQVQYFMFPGEDPASLSPEQATKNIVCFVLVMDPAVASSMAQGWESKDFARDGLQTPKNLKRDLVEQLMVQVKIYKSLAEKKNLPVVLDQLHYYEEYLTGLLSRFPAEPGTQTSKYAVEIEQTLTSLLKTLEATQAAGQARGPKKYTPLNLSF